MGMQTITQSISTHVIGFVESLRRQLCDGDFSARHRVRPEDFTRQRQLTFPVVMLFILQKTVKSIQRHLHEFLDELAGGGMFEPVTASAWTHARAKLKHTAFMELNAQTVLTEPTTTGLDEQTLGNEHPQQINYAVAFHALKDQLLALLYIERP